MRRKTALLISGIVTAFAMVLVLGLLSASARDAQAAQQAPAPSEVVPASDPAGTATADQVASLQAEVDQYKTALNQAYSDLQAAYSQIQQLQAQTSGGRLRRGGGSERNNGSDN